MGRKVRTKVAKTGNVKVVLPSHPETKEGLSLDHEGLVDWTRLPDDMVIHLFSSLNHRDRANMSSTCRTWRNIGMSPCLWQSLDLRAHKCEATTTSSLASRCENLEKLRFRGDEIIDAIINLRARGLREISGDLCRNITNATLFRIAARHGALEILELGPFCDKISSIAIKAIAICCPNLRKLRLSGIRDVDGVAIDALANHCLRLIEIGLVDCGNIDEVAVGLDVSRTNVTSSVVQMLSSSERLKVLCALHCPALKEGDRSSTNYYPRGKLIIAFFTDIFKELASLLEEITTKESNVFSDWRNMKKKDKNVDEIMTWVEWILSYSLLRIADTSLQGFDNFWISQGAALSLNLLQSSQEDVQERAATVLATFAIIVNENARVDGGMAKAVMRGGGIRLLLNLARSWREGLQSEATKAITNLSVNADVAKAVVEEGGIDMFLNLARSMYSSVAGQAAGGLWNLSITEEHKHAIAEAGAVKALVGLIDKWFASGSGDRVLEFAAGALTNIATDYKLCMEVAELGGVRALVMLARDNKSVRVQEQAARALANLASHAYDNGAQAPIGVGQEAGAVQALVKLTYSTHEGVRMEAASALWNLSFDDERNPEAIAAAGGVEALVYLAQSCSNASQDLKERAAGALWGLAVSEVNRIAVGQGGGIAPLVALVRSAAHVVHETAAGALWLLSLNPSNALRIVMEGGVPALINVCSCSASKVARFMAALAMANIFDGRMEELEEGTSSVSASTTFSIEMTKIMALKKMKSFLRSFCDSQTFAAAAASSALPPLRQVAESSQIEEAGHLRCSGAEIGRFVTMLRNPCSEIKACAIFALFQFTTSGGRHVLHHVALLRDAGAPRVLRTASAASITPVEAKVYARIVLRNLE
ncbi:hypothetical protein Vadar_015272 [Vaccinium darrowii]|uniref:Uncharacterized protein n=1 Tax=Vaccinium darrowii TaxID=229202 RepID=A0ACB7ZBT4_9ERIC|nr:hypothetical protein Vadar_015272 [Vaccinium darrowii]